MTTLLQIPYGDSSTPPSILLGELAIAAGMAGFPLTLCYEGFPAPLLCQIWRYYTQLLPPGAVLHIHTQRDLNQLVGRMSEVRVVLVHTGRLQISTAWSIQLAELPDAESRSRPAMFSRFVPDDLNEAPGATLVVRCTSNETNAIARWLHAESYTDEDQTFPNDTIDVEIPSWLTAVLSPNYDEASQLQRRFEDTQILHGLLVGAGALRSARNGAWAATVTPEDYELVRQLLQSPILLPPGVPFDPLAAAMVNRANVYLAAKSGRIYQHRAPLAVRDYDDTQDQHGRARRELITRREVANLGNVRSGIVRRLVEHLCQGNEGHEWYCRMGLVRQLPELDAWQRASAASLTTNLVVIRTASG